MDQEYSSLISENLEETLIRLTSFEVNDNLNVFVEEIKCVFNYVNFEEYKVFIENLYYEIEIIIINKFSDEELVSLTIRNRYTTKIYFNNKKFLLRDFKKIPVKDVLIYFIQGSVPDRSDLKNKKQK